MIGFLFSGALRGLIVGGTMLVPGVSGGSMAMLLGIYDELIAAVSRPFRAGRRRWLLTAFVLGAGTGMLLIARPLLSLIGRWPKPMLSLFLGAVAGGLPMIIRRTQRFGWRQALCLAAGLASVLALGLLPEGALRTRTTPVMLVAIGIVTAAALILPGVSTSHFLLVLGIYDDTMRAVSRLDARFLFPLALGGALGILTTARLLERALNRRPDLAYPAVLGFVLGSALELLPPTPVGWEWPLCFAAAAAGFLAIALLERMEALKAKSRQPVG